MRKRLLGVVVLLVTAPVLFTACFDSKDFDFNKFKVSNLHPTLYVPLLRDTVDILSVDIDGLYFDTDGQAYFEHTIDEIEIPLSLDDLLIMGSQQMVDLLVALPIPVGPSTIEVNFPPDGSSTYIAAELDFGTAATEVRPDSIVFNSLRLSFTNKQALSSGMVHISIPNLTKNGQPFTWEIPVTGVTPVRTNLNDYSLKIDHNGTKNELRLEYRFEAISSEDSTFNEIGFTLGLEQSFIKEAYGYFGQYTTTPKIQPFGIGNFNKLSGTWNLKEAFVVLDVLNPLVLPMQITVDRIASYPSSGSPIVVNNVGTVVITAPSKLSDPPAQSSSTLGGTNLSPVISALPRLMDVSISAAINPGGETSNAIGYKQLMTAKAKVVVPFKIKDTQITLSDTLEFNVEDISLTNMGINLHVENAFPIALTLKCELLEEKTGRNLGPLFTPISIPAATIKPKPGVADESVVDQPAVFDNNGQLIAITDDMARNMKKSDRVKIYFEAAVPDGNYTCITQQNNIYFKIGMRATIDVNP